MWFKNLIAYRLGPTELTGAILEEKLSLRPLQQLGQTDQSTRGWVPTHKGGSLVLSVSGHYLIALGITTRQLPGSVVAEALEKRSAEIEAQQGYKCGRTQMREIKEVVIAELLPQAFPRTSKIFAWIDPAGGWIGINTASLGTADTLLEALRDTLDTLPVKLIRTRLSPVSVMADWLAWAEATGDFTVDSDTRLVSVADGGSAIGYSSVSLDAEDIRTRLAAGYLPERLGVTWDDRLSFVLTEKMIVKRLAFLDVLKEKANQDAAEDATSKAEADFALMSGEFARLLPAVVEALGGEVEEAL